MTYVVLYSMRFYVIELVVAWGYYRMSTFIYDPWTIAIGSSVIGGILVHIAINVICKAICNPKRLYRKRAANEEYVQTIKQYILRKPTITIAEFDSATI